MMLARNDKAEWKFRSAANGLLPAVVRLKQSLRRGVAGLSSDYAAALHTSQISVPIPARNSSTGATAGV